MKIYRDSLSLREGIFISNLLGAGDVFVDDFGGVDVVFRSEDCNQGDAGFADIYTKLFAGTCLVLPHDY